MKKIVSACLIFFILLSLFACYAPSLEAQGFTYVFVGPVFDNDASSSGGTALLSLTTVNGVNQEVAVSYGTSYSYSGAQLVACSWNFSTTLNLTRVIEFLPADGTSRGAQSFQLLTANPDWIMGVYLFNVVDYTGQAEFIEVRLGNVVVERRSLALSGSADFTLYKGLSYTLNVVGVSGVYSQMFTAGNLYSTNVILLAGSFGEVEIGDGVTDRFVATRPEPDIINVSFNSPVTSGTFNFTILKRDGQHLYPVYSAGVAATSLPYSFVWSNAEVLADYVVEGFQFAADGSLSHSWKVALPIDNVRTNPWAALLAPFAVSIETLPGSAVLPAGFDVAQVPVALILALVLAVFSWKNHGVGCLLCWVVAVIMVALGWFVVSLPAFGFALFTSILIVFVEGKKTEREL